MSHQSNLRAKWDNVEDKNRSKQKEECTKLKIQGQRVINNK